MASLGARVNPLKRLSAEKDLPDFIHDVTWFGVCVCVGGCLSHRLAVNSLCAEDALGLCEIVGVHTTAGVLDILIVGKVRSPGQDKINCPVPYRFHSIWMWHFAQRMPLSRSHTLPALMGRWCLLHVSWYCLYSFNKVWTSCDLHHNPWIL